MELLFHSVARAGGIELPPEVRFFAAPEKAPWERRLLATLARALSGLARRLAASLTRTAGRLAERAAEDGGHPVAP
jgi:hypothetical protein